MLFSAGVPSPAIRPTGALPQTASSRASARAPLHLRRTRLARCWAAAMPLPLPATGPALGSSTCRCFPIVAPLHTCSPCIFCPLSFREAQGSGSSVHVPKHVLQSSVRVCLMSPCCTPAWLTCTSEDLACNGEAVREIMRQKGMTDVPLGMLVESILDATGWSVGGEAGASGGLGVLYQDSHQGAEQIWGRLVAPVPW